MNENINTEKWVHAISRTPEEAEIEYNKVCFNYDDNVSCKGYDAPAVAAKMLGDNVSTEQKVLDVGCGTGLVGMALSELGFSNITGLDISTNSLKIAGEKKVYAGLERYNLLEPLPFECNTFGATICIGVFSRFNDDTIFKLLMEFSRITKSGGVIVFSHREDLMKDSEIIEGINNSKKLTVERLTEAMPYFPLDDNFKGIGVHYIVLRNG